MDVEKTKNKTKVKWIPILALSIFSLVLGFLLMHLLPDKRGLVLFGLYSIPSHMLISLFPHEPMLLFYAKSYTPWQISIAGTVGCCIAAFLDYWLLMPFFNRHSIRDKFESKKFFKKAVAFFHKFPFWFLAIAAYSPVPFYPFKFLTFASGYPLWKYQAALIAGRTPRYFTLAVLGYMLQPPTWVLIVMFLIITLPPVVQKTYSWAKSKIHSRRSKEVIYENSLDNPEFIFSEYEELIPARERTR